MSDKPVAVLQTIRRGEELDELDLIDTAGRVVILHAHGIHDDERARTREAALELLGEALARLKSS